jgi:2,3-bisphosphoglycerate-independent phosphoglycerate mutase
MRPKPVVLIIRDGWGIRKSRKANAVALAKTPNADNYIKKYPTSVLKCHGMAVGLPRGYQGNSEVGHLHIGAGRIVPEMLTLINMKIENRKFFRDRELMIAVKNCKKNNSTLHIMGLVQDEGVHAHQKHCAALLQLAKMNGLRDVVVHVFSDGRDTPPKSAMKYINYVKKEMKRLGVGRFGVLVGRYYAMDRDNRWKRTELAYNALINAKGKRFKTIIRAVEDAYKKRETDEFIKPRIIGDFSGIKDKDSIIFFNYRLDRARQITHAFLDDNFRHFKREKRDVEYICFAKYYDKLSDHFAFDEPELKNILGKVLSKNGLRQLRSAETEKYAHVTFFFNAEVEKPFKGEKRIMVLSPKVATYDMKPEMSAYKVTRKVLSQIRRGNQDVIIMNYANGDMVGHTGKLKSAIKAVEVVDKCVGKIVNAATKKGGVCLITADHGNCEDMIGGEITSHTKNDVYIHIVGMKKKIKLKNGGLSDIAPTILDILGIKKPREMTGKSLIK